MDVTWSATPARDVPDWTGQQVFDGSGPCRSCGRVTMLRADPFAGQPVCRPCWEACVYGADDEP